MLARTALAMAVLGAVAVAVAVAGCQGPTASHEPPSSAGPGGSEAPAPTATPVASSGTDSSPVAPAIEPRPSGPDPTIDVPASILPLLRSLSLPADGPGG